MKFGKFKSKKKANVDRRKQARKLKRLEKKKHKVEFYQRRKQSEQMVAPQAPNEAQPKSILRKPKRAVAPKQKAVRLQPEAQNEDDRIIRMYGEKLSKGSKRKLKNELLNDGFDDDLFDFLDGITKKVKGSKEVQYEDQQDQDQIQEEVGEPEAYHNQNAHEDQQNLGEQGEQEEGQQQESEGMMIDEQDQEGLQPEVTPEERLKLRKSLNGLLNKLSDENLVRIFKELNDIFLFSNKVTVSQIFWELFLKLNIENPRMLINILATNVAVVSGLQQIHGNGFFGGVLKGLVDRYVSVMSEGEGEGEDRLPRLRNIVNSLCYFYLFDSITSGFLKELIEELTQAISPLKLELLLVAISTVGSKLRQDDPQTLKDIIDVVRERFSSNPQMAENKKAGFILDEINQIKFNRKEDKLDARFAFLRTFLRRDILESNALEQRVFVLGWNAVVKASPEGDPYWYEPNASRVLEENTQEHQQIDQELLLKQRYYEQLAREQKMVTEFRKKVFIAIITAEDYIDAVDKLVGLKSKRFSEIAAVIVETCTQEKTFNPFYYLLVCKLVSLIPKFRPAFQFAVWDQEKQLEDFTLRKISNLAKLLARVVLTSPECSLSMLKNLNDLCSASQHEQIFLTVFFEEFFANLTRVRAKQLVDKLRDSQQNTVFRQVLLEYLKEEYLSYAKKTNKQFIEILVFTIRILSLKDEQEQTTHRDND